ncbi:MAG: phosphoribosylformylglycinamidine synthase subunit PurL [Anaerolineae bacterium]|nr:phosphoribosylformylglycinamidine synthase subunit PurL [Anaerolineae bacterium]
MSGNNHATAVYRLEVHPRTRRSSDKLVNTAHQLGLSGLTACYPSRLYFIQGQLTAAEVERIGREILADPVTERLEIGDWRLTSAANLQSPISNLQTIEVTLHPGVTDPPADNLVRAARLIGIAGIERAATGQRYEVEGALGEAAVHTLAAELLANPVIQHFAIGRPITPPFVATHPADDTVELIDLREADDNELLTISRERRLSMDLAEMQAIQSYYRVEGRAATDVELEMLAQTWSEHCVHKTFKAIIEYDGPDGKETINGLLNTYIRAATDKVNKPWVLSAFVDNAGIISFDEQFDLAFKVETHNHPSALEPFGGANTGVGGVVRDVLGVSARPIANTDVLCFGLPDMAHDDLPAGVLHPRRIADGVIHGIEDYGNKMGIPTVNGSIHYHPGYTANPLVYCGCLGILPHGAHVTAVQPGDLVVAIGGRTGRDGLRGATFSSMEMDTATSEIAGTAVQIGNPIMEKQVQEVILRARDEKLYTAITDCGAGGFSSAVGEMAKETGAAIQLQAITLKYPGLRPWEMWLSEAQERMVLAVPPIHLPRLQALCAGQDVEAIVLGTFTGNGRLTINYGDKVVADLTADFLHDGIPTRHLRAEWKPVIGNRLSVISQPITDHRLPITLLSLLAHPTIRSKEDVIRRYDHEVQGGTAVKPLTGTHNHGPSDATVLAPQASQFIIHNSSFIIQKGVALANGINPHYPDPYHMAWAAVDEAMRNVTAVGADPDQVAILDNFCWGNPNLPDRLGALVRCAQGCYDAAVAFGAPFVSGKDSLNNEYTGADGEKHAIPGTLLISALGIVPDVSKTVTMDLKQAGNFLFVVGDTRAEMGGSHFNLVSGPASEGNNTPPAPVKEGLARLRRLHKAMQAGLVQACHDCAEGGVAVALAEMCMAGGLGLEAHLMRIPRDYHANYAGDEVILFSESLSRFLVEIRPEDEAAFRAIMGDEPAECIGVVGGERLVVNGRTGDPLFALTIAEMEEAWRGTVIGDQLSVIGKRSTTTDYRLPITDYHPKVLILHANGSNRDHDAALACQLAGGAPEIVHMNQLLAGERRLADYHMLIIPGGFSYGDDLGAGVLWALDLRYAFGEALARFVADGRPVLGICNGFQTLVKAGLLPGNLQSPISNPSATLRTGLQSRSVTLTFNRSGQFECRWVYLQPNPASPSLFTQGLDEPIYCPVAHGEGRLAAQDEATAAMLQAQNLVPLTYTVNGSPVTRHASRFTDYPANPNGSILDIAALCNPAGNVLGLMPHPENHIFPWQHPRAHRGERGMLGLRLFENGIKNA